MLVQLTTKCRALVSSLLTFCGSRVPESVAEQREVLQTPPSAPSLQVYDEERVFYASCSRSYTWQSLTWVGSIHGSDWVGSVWVRLGHKILSLGWVGLGGVRCQKIYTKYRPTIYTQKPIIRRLLAIIRNCSIAIYYRLIIYSNIKDVLFGQKGSGAWNDDVAIWVK